MQLRGGQRTTDLGFDRLPFFDARSRNYPVTAGLDTSQRRSYTWALPIPVLDQGPDGACVGFGVAHELAAKPVVVPALDADDARAIYWAAQRADEWEGGSYPGATPFYEGTSVLAGVKAAQAMGHYPEYRWAFGLDDLIWAVGWKGPAILGVNWYTDMFRPDLQGRIHPTGAWVGGHCILVNGVSLRRREFLLPNSWGPEWSSIDWNGVILRGYCKVTFEDMGLLLHENGEACIPKRSPVT
jgi:hypothetical protein